MLRRSFLASVFVVLAAPFAMSAIPTLSAACSCCNECRCVDCLCDELGCACDRGGDCCCESQCCAPNCCSDGQSTG